MEYKKISTNKLKANNYNPNEMDGNSFNHLVKEMKRVGFLQPILVNKNGIIIDGEHRWRAALELNFKTVPVIQIDVSDKEAKTITVNMNQIKGELNPIEFAKLVKDLREDYDVQDLMSVFDMSHLQLESYETLLTMPDLTDDDFKEELSSEKNKCPECGYKW